MSTWAGTLLNTVIDWMWPVIFFQAEESIVSTWEAILESEEYEVAIQQPWERSANTDAELTILLSQTITFTAMPSIQQIGMKCFQSQPKARARGTNVLAYFLESMINSGRQEETLITTAPKTIKLKKGSENRFYEHSSCSKADKESINRPGRAQVRVERVNQRIPVSDLPLQLNVEDYAIIAASAIVVWVKENELIPAYVQNSTFSVLMCEETNMDTKAEQGPWELPLSKWVGRPREWRALSEWQPNEYYL